VAWYMLSNESYMNRVMSDVLPTIVSSIFSKCRLLLHSLSFSGMGSHTALFP
jgi:hypothetical protein